MSITIDLTDAEEATLRSSAAVRNLDLIAYIRERVFAEPEETSFLRLAGQEAIQIAREKLHAQGIGAIVGENGKVVRQHPDGTTEILVPAEDSTP